MPPIQRFFLFLALFRFYAEAVNIDFDDENDANNHFLINPNQQGAMHFPLQIPAQNPVQGQQTNFILPRFHLMEEVYDFRIFDANDSPAITQFSPVSLSFPLSLDLIFYIFEFLFQANTNHRELAQIRHILETSKSLYNTGHLFMALQLRPFKFCYKPASLHSALFVAASGLERQFSGIVNRPIAMEDLLEIIMAAKFDIYNEPFLNRALGYLHGAVHGGKCSAVGEFGVYRERRADPLLWFKRAFRRIFCLNQLPYSAEMYLTSGFLTPTGYFRNILDMDPCMVEPFLKRFLAIPELDVTFEFMLSRAVDKGNVPVLDLILVNTANVDISVIDRSNHLITLVGKNALSVRLLALSRGNERLMEASLDAALYKKNFEIFTALLEAYDFNNSKWIGCKYLLDRRDDRDYFYDHELFMDKFIKDRVDIDVFPLLMPVFSLAHVHFKEIFQKLVHLDTYDFMEPKAAQHSLIYHVALSTENYFALLPADVTMLYINCNDKLAHVKSIIPRFDPGIIENILRKFKNPLDLLYYSSTSAELQLLAEQLHIFNLNQSIFTALSRIGMSPKLPVELNFLRQVKEWKLIHLAIVFQRTGLIELILLDPEFDRHALNFKLGGQIDALELTAEIVRLQCESPYFSICAHPLESIFGKLYL